MGDILLVRAWLEWDSFGDVETETFEPSALGRVICHYAHRFDPEIHKHLGADAILEAVDGVPWRNIGVDTTLFPQFVGPDFVIQGSTTVTVAA